MSYSVVVPLFRSESGIDVLVSRLTELSVEFESELEAVFVIDGSPDNSWNVLLERYKNFPFKATLVNLSRNFGAIAATRQGLRHATGEAIVVMSADCQEPLPLIVSLLRAVKDQGFEIAVGVRTKRSDPYLTRLLSGIFWRLFRASHGGSIPKRGVDIFAVSARVASLITGLKESSSSLIGLLYWLGFSIQPIEYVREKRASGKSSWSLQKRFRYAIDSITTFSDSPIVLLVAGGFIGATFSFAYGLVVILRQVIWSQDPKGYVPIFVGLLFIASILLLGMGILGMYIWRIAENVRGRPDSVVWSSAQNFPNINEFDGPSSAK